jgi:hypothetical protein
MDGLTVRPTDGGRACITSPDHGQASRRRRWRQIDACVRPALTPRPVRPEPDSGGPRPSTLGLWSGSPNELLELAAFVPFVEGVLEEPVQFRGNA